MEGINAYADQIKVYKAVLDATQEVQKWLRYHSGKCNYFQSAKSFYDFGPMMYMWFPLMIAWVKTTTFVFSDHKAFFYLTRWKPLETLWQRLRCLIIQTSMY